MSRLGLAVFQQVTGINAVIYYSDKIFDAAGFTTPHAQTIATIISVGAVNCLATLSSRPGPSTTRPARHRRSPPTHRTDNREPVVDFLVGLTYRIYRLARRDDP